MNDTRPSTRRAATDISPKVTAATLAAAVTTIGVYVFESTTGIDLPSLVEGAITTILVFGGGYVIRDR